MRRPSHSATHTSTQGSTISPVNRPKDSPDALNASRLVRFDTGSSSEPLLASRVQAYSCGRLTTPSAAVVVRTTGVQQYDGRIQGQGGGDGRGERDDESEQPLRTALRQGGGASAEVVEDACLGAEVTEDEDRREEADGRTDASKSVAGGVDRNDFERDDEDGGRHRGDGLAQPAGTQHREGECADQQHERDDLCDRPGHEGRA